MMKRFFAAAALGLLLGVATPAMAGPITYTVQATASGSLGGTPFTDALVTVTFTGDTANVINDGGILRNLIGTATVTVDSLATATFTDAMQVFDNPALQAAGVADTTAGPASVLDTFNAAFATYDLTTAIGPVSGSPFINSGESFPTSAGGFILTSSGDSTFTATTNAAAAPEPSTLTLAGLGILGLFGSRLRGRKS